MRGSSPRMTSHGLSFLYHFPAAFRSASLRRSCQPGPASRKYSRTSWSIRRLTCSFTPGSGATFLTGASTGLAVTFLKAASASVRASLSVLGLLGGSAISDSFEQRGRQIALGERRHNGKNGLARRFRPLADLKRGRDRRA